MQATFNELGVLRHLKEMGYDVIAVGRRIGTQAREYVDEYYDIDYSDREEVLKLAKEKNVDFICSACNDTAALTKLYLTEELGLSGTGAA